MFMSMPKCCQSVALAISLCYIDVNMGQNDNLNHPTVSRGGSRHFQKGGGGGAGACY